MKTIRIAHLYYDILNLYGENGNIRALVKFLEQQEVKVIVNFLSIDDEINFKNFDCFYIGEGTVDNTVLVLKDLIKYQNDIKKAVEANKLFIVTGDSISMFGKTLYHKDIEHPALNIFEYTAKSIDFRIVGEQFYSSSLLKKDIIGFQNRETILVDVKNPLFTVTTGTGFKPNDEFEGINKNNFYGTYLLGPLLIRNPYLTELFVKKLLKEKDIKYKKVKEDVSYIAYTEYIKNFKN